MLRDLRYTTVYVTHDQSEAMTTADLICVMNGGRVEQFARLNEPGDQPQRALIALLAGDCNGQAKLDAITSHGEDRQYDLLAINIED